MRYRLSSLPSSQRRFTTYRRRWRQRRESQRGFTMLIVLLAGILLIGLLTAYALISKVENVSAISSADSSTGFYVAETGLNLRAKEVSTRFLNRQLPLGVSPTSVSHCTDADATNNGTGDFDCRNYDITGAADTVRRQASTYIVDTTNYSGAGPNPTVSLTRIPPGEPFAGLNAQEYSYELNSVGQKMTQPIPRTEAILSLGLRLRVVPMFQFAAFYGNDLEFFPNIKTTITGPVYTSGSLFLGAGNPTTNDLTVAGQVLTVGGIYNRRKSNNQTYADGTVKINSAVGNPINLLSGGTGSTTQTTAAMNPTLVSTTWGSQVTIGVPPVNLPDPGILTPTGEYYDKADLRITYLPNAGASNPHFAIAKVDSTSALLPRPGTDLAAYLLASLQQPVLVPAAVRTAGYCSAPTPPLDVASPLRSLTVAQKQALAQAIYAATLSQNPPVPYSKVSNVADPGSTNNQLLQILPNLFTPSGVLARNTAVNYGAWTTAQTDALKLATAAQTVDLSDQCFVTAPIQETTDFYNVREDRSMSLLQTNFASLAIWNRDGRYINASAANPDNNAQGYGISGDPLFDRATADTTAPAGSFQNLGLAAADISEAGLVVHAAVSPSNTCKVAGQCADSNTSPYGFAISGGSQLPGLSNSSTMPDPTGLTFVSDQAVYLQGDYNTNNKQPAAILADTINVLSNACLNSNSQIEKLFSPSGNNMGCTNGSPSVSLLGQPAVSTTINAAFLSGKDLTLPGTNNQGYNGGLENYARLHEFWSGSAQTFTYRGSFVALGEPQHVSGPWNNTGVPRPIYYVEPIRDFNYDTHFDNANNLPPLDPRFVYMKQQTFVRSFGD
jgi:hypothetical protein